MNKGNKGITKNDKQKFIVESRETNNDCQSDDYYYYYDEKNRLGRRRHFSLSLPVNKERERESYGIEMCNYGKEKEFSKKRKKDEVI